MKNLIINIGLIALVTLLLILGMLWFTKIYTNHGTELVKVENLEGDLSRKAINKLSDAGLEGVVIDTVYKDGAKKLSVINQNPAPGLMVKPGRKVYLVINSANIPMVEVPSLAGETSLAQARNMLSRRHLKVGKIIKKAHSSVRSRTDEPVLEQLEHGTTDHIPPGKLIERNSEIDLVIGVPQDYYGSDSTSSGGGSAEGAETPVVADP